VHVYAEEQGEVQMIQCRYVDEAQAQAIRAIPHFASSAHRDFDLNGSVDFYVRRYVRPLAAFVEIGEGDVVADIGAGYGWLSVAFALASRARVIAVEINEPRLEAARRISEILGVADRIDWRVGGLGQLPLGDREARVVYCIEVIEHIRRSCPAIRDLNRVTAEALVITTPNLYFPLISHDTQLPFCHWLPLALRARYAEICGRTDCENDNLFWSPRTLLRELPDFEVASRFLHYASRRDYLSTFPFYLPYVGGGMRHGDGRLKSAYYALAAFLGRHSLYVMPSLACTLRRHLAVPALSQRLAIPGGLGVAATSQPKRATVDSTQAALIGGRR
jgi:2-polyprenyl-3-methyl-5-hydroxy-6-metoxy-1,4-benzoquinol methylase